jgi:hypothetical protein
MDLARAPRRAPLTARKKGSGYENVWALSWLHDAMTVINFFLNSGSLEKLEHTLEVISQIHEQNTKKTGAIYHQGKYQFHFDQL